jgi:signal transduction histidine kinase
MAAQLDGLVDASRLEAGRPLELRRDPTDIVGLARQVIVEHQQTSDRHQIDLASSEPEIVGTWDGMRLGRVLDNLLSNAIKYSPRGGTVEVRLTRQGEPAPGWAVLSVQDHGEGIPEIDLPHIFEHFRRGKNVVGRFPGTGIGLSGVRHIVEQHGGTIGVESRVGHGTTFTVRLPMEAELG